MNTKVRTCAYHNTPRALMNDLSVSIFRMKQVNYLYTDFEQISNYFIIAFKILYVVAFNAIAKIFFVLFVHFKRMIYDA